MKRLFLVVFAILGIIFGDGLVSAVGVNDFTITNFDVNMSLSRDSDKRSVLKTVETITAIFPDFDQNHGLERAFVKTYDGHDISFNLESVTNEKGEALPYHWSGDNLRIGDANTFVHGTQTYKISYTQHDVTKYYSDTNRDEFYWDVIGIDWRVPISQANITIDLSDDLAALPRSEPQCYWGSIGSKNSCTVTKTGSVYSAVATDLLPGQGVTMAVGFDKGTFSVYKKPWYEALFGLWFIWQFINPIFGGIILIISGILHRKMIQPKKIGTIVPEYLPPKNYSVTVSAAIGNYIYGDSTTAQLIDLAVRHYIKIYEIKQKTWLKPAEYDIEITKDISDLKWEEREVLKDMFGNADAKVGERMSMKSLNNNYLYQLRLKNNYTDLKKLIRGEYGLEEARPDYAAASRKVGLLLLISGLLTLSIVLAMMSGIAFIRALAAWRSTDKAVELKQYLEGLRLYISVAEKERLKMLQSPEGAQKVADFTVKDGDAKYIKLYERVLPYAIIFGEEEQWIEQLGVYYKSTDTQPNWFVGQTGVFSAAAFTSAMNSFSSSNYASSYSSSSGGSDGGGSSGGGGGGGGGGGW